MASVERPNPDELLARVARKQAKARRGRLKIFFGMAAGVGKTYAMLLAARERRAENLDIVVGLVETHDRPETKALLQGLELLPSRRIDYRGAVLREFDLDAALKRRPSIILVDELAHTNAPGSRHPKRWQDIEELLDAGIDVYTTLNVQHLESLNDDIGQIAGIRIWETVPDTVFEEADEVELVDLPPDELLLRLKEGKVYLPQQAQEAIRNFFRKGNLIALRELALRQTAHRVDAQMLDYREDNAIREIWQVSERILVCIGPNVLLGERLVRAGKRFAAGLRADWIVVYVETPELQRLPAEQRDAVLKVLRIAEQLGAETVTLSSPAMSEAILKLASERNVTKIMMGKPSRRGWRRFALGSVVDTLILEAHNINIYLLGSPQKPGEEESAELSKRRKEVQPGLLQRSKTRKKGYYLGYLWAFGVTLISAVLAKLMHGRFEQSNLAMIFLLGVALIASRFGRGPSVFASVLGVLVFDFFFVTPFHSFAVSDTQYLVTLGAMMAVAMLISNLTANVRSQAKVAAHRERRASVLYAMSKDLAAAKSEDEIVRMAVRHIHVEFGGHNVILFPDTEGRIVFPKEESLLESLRGADLSVAQWVFDHNELAGQGTTTLPGSKAVYFPIDDGTEVLGVLVLEPANLRRVFLPEQQKLLATFLRLIAQALTRLWLADQTKSVQLQIEAEGLRNSLLSSISHDLRTPLATIVGSASTLAEDDDKLKPEDRVELSRAIYDEARRMSNLVSNILDMARLDAGMIQLHKDWYPVEEIIGTVLTRFSKQMAGRNVKVVLPPGIPLIYCDAVMIEQVLTNLLENALRYTPAGSPLEITADVSVDKVEISLADHGPGIPEGLENRLFEKFYRLRDETAQSGVGLGLPICRAIVTVHGGSIRAHNRPEGGAIFTFTLPLDQPPPEALQDEEAF